MFFVVQKAWETKIFFLALLTATVDIQKISIDITARHNYTRGVTTKKPKNGNMFRISDFKNITRHF